MSELGACIHIAHDDEGAIHVHDDGRFRYLTFGNAVEQSCLDLADPPRLVHVYTQAMMLGLLLAPGVRRVLLLGVGGGSLARALRAADRGLQITGVERRAAVLDVARAYFRLPDDRRFRAVCEDADSVLAADADPEGLILADLYLATGMYPRQVAGDFLARCRARLAEGGILVLNQWASEFPANRTANATLMEVFDGRLLQLHVQGGNIITFAFRDALPNLRRDTFFDGAQALGMRLAIPMQRHARNLWRQNAETLGTGRFRSRMVR